MEVYANSCRSLVQKIDRKEDESFYSCSAGLVGHKPMFSGWVVIPFGLIHLGPYFGIINPRRGVCANGCNQLGIGGKTTRSA